MIFNEHSRYAGKHAVLSASDHAWVRYSDEKMIERLRTREAAALGTRKHNFAAEAIKLRIKLAGRNTLAMYVNDAIGYMMTPEQMLYVSDNCFGTADAIDFRKGKLRIHDLKTGTSPASIEQLEVYAAMFCLEYNLKPYEIEMELRIYQNNDKEIFDADPEAITKIMGRIIHLDRLITKSRQEELA